MSATGGDYHYPNEVTGQAPQHKLLLVAGGVGINPIISILRHVRDTSSSAAAASVLFSAKTSQELLFRSDLEEMRANGEKEGVDVRLFVTGQESDRSESVQRRRMCKDDFKAALEKLQPTKDAPVFCYLCGPTAMIKEIKQNLTELGIDEKHIFYELWE